MKTIHEYKISIVLSMLGFLCLITYALIGARIDENGALIEPFGLIPLFWFFQLLAFLSLIIVVIKRREKK